MKTRINPECGAGKSLPFNPATGGTVCAVCSKHFFNDRAFNAHVKRAAK